MISGQDVIGQAQTGTGKTAAFALPMLHNLQPDHKHIQGLVLAPTRELALQVAEAISIYGQFLNVRVLAVYGGASYNTQISQLKRGVDIVVGTPGRLLDLMSRKLLDIHQIRTLVLDEADEMLSMGFIEDIEAILTETPATRQTALFSATLPAEIRRLAERYLRNPHTVTIKREQMTVEAIEQRYYLVNAKDKLAALTRLFEMEEPTSTLIFVRTRVTTSDLANELTMRGFPAEALSSDLNQDARERTLGRFRKNQVKVLVATDVAARGLDIDDISHVFNYDLPDDPEIYVHRIGRTGRAGKTGIAISLVAPFEKRRLGQIESFTRHKVQRQTLPSETDITNRRQEQLLNRVKVWLQRARYRQERALVEQLVEEGFDAIEIAAAALKVARADEKQRPIAALSEVIERRPASDSRRQPETFHSRGSATRRNGDRGFSTEDKNRPSRQGDRAWQSDGASHEAGMVRLSMNIGKQDGIRPSDIVGAIAFHADIPGNRIGKILIHDQRSLLDVPEELVAQVLAKRDDVRIRRQPIEIQRA
jgi:ATP-dependent RNA helicase DeaD